MPSVSGTSPDTATVNVTGEPCDSGVDADGSCATTAIGRFCGMLACTWNCMRALKPAPVTAFTASGYVRPTTSGTAVVAPLVGCAGTSCMPVLTIADTA